MIRNVHRIGSGTPMSGFNGATCRGFPHLSQGGKHDLIISLHGRPEAVKFRYRTGIGLEIHVIPAHPQYKVILGEGEGLAGLSDAVPPPGDLCAPRPAPNTHEPPTTLVCLVEGYKEL